jgi:hypothetical protein
MMIKASHVINAESAISILSNHFLCIAAIEGKQHLETDIECPYQEFLSPAR